MVEKHHLESFYVSPTNIRGDELVLDADEAHHLYRVLRKKKGDMIRVVDGEGGAYESEILYIAKNEVRCRVRQTRRRLGEPIANVTLIQGVLKGDRFDWLVEKATEIGVRRIIPLISENSVASAGDQKVARWRRIGMAAMKQSGRSILPEITESKTFKQALSLGINYSFRLIAHSESGSQLLVLPESNRPLTTPKILLMAGPEGGFTHVEYEEAVNHGFQPVTLGSRRLRGETAGVVLTALVLFQLGDLE
jgi:16S rRNA (uracil1498-N3)-methyltransferase